MLERSFVACTVKTAHKRLTSVADALQQQIDDADDVRYTCIDRDRLLSAIGHRKAVYDNKRYIRREGKTERCKADLQYPKCRFRSVGSCDLQSEILFSRAVNKRHGHRYALPDNRRQSRAVHSLIENPHEGIVEDDVRGKAADHGKHCPHRASVIAHKRNKPCAEYLQNGAECDHPYILIAEREQIARCAERSENAF